VSIGHNPMPTEPNHKATLGYLRQTPRAEDIAKAEEWTRKAMETRRASDEKKAAGQDPTQP
jgi:hypothetical protein